MSHSNIDFDLDGIGHQLHSRKMQVPLYQRSYAWKVDHLKDFRNDLTNAFNSPNGDHFMGTIVLSGEGDRDTVIDGQQRLATTTLLFVALRDFYLKNGNSDRAINIEAEYLSSFSDQTAEYEPRLRMNAEDDEFFRQFIVRDSTTVAATRPSHKLIQAAMDSMAEFVQLIAENAGNQWVAKLVAWRKFVDENVRVIYVKVPTDSDAFMIFETLNDRGANLTLADLLKNYLFGKKV